MKEDKTIFIERKKKVSGLEKIKSYYSKWENRMIGEQYQYDKILWRVSYDKIYRKEVYDFLMLTQDEKDLNFVRNMYHIKSEKIGYPNIKSNDYFIDDDPEFYVENNYLLQSFKLYKYEKYSFYLYAPLVIPSLYFKYKNNDILFTMLSALFVGVLYTNYSSSNKRKAFYEYNDKKIESRNETGLDVYKRLFYINM
jgi:hypothetical protein